MADRFGRRRVFQLGLVVFTLGSFLCSRAPASSGWWPSGSSRPSAGRCSTRWPCRSSGTPSRTPGTGPGHRGMGSGGGGQPGPGAGHRRGAGPDGGMAGHLLVNIPVGVAAIVLTALFVPESRPPRRAGSTRSGRCWSSSSWVPDLLDHRGAGPRIRLAGDRRPAGALSPLVTLSLVRAATASPCSTSGSSAHPVLRGHRHRRLRLRRPQRLPLPEHPLPPGCPGLLGARRRAAPCHGGHDHDVSPISGRLVGRRGARMPLMAAGSPSPSAA